MSLTPEQWRDLDEAEREFKSSFPKRPSWRGDQDDAWMRYHLAHASLGRLVDKHLRTLIDAARPKCERCGGDGGWPGHLMRHIECHDCNGTGWAQ